MSCYLWLSSELSSTQLRFSAALAYARISGPISHNQEAKLKPFLPELQWHNLHVTLAVHEAQWHFLGYLLDLNHEARCSTPAQGQLSFNFSEISMESSFLPPPFILPDLQVDPVEMRLLEIRKAVSELSVE